MKKYIVWLWVNSNYKSGYDFHTLKDAKWFFNYKKRLEPTLKGNIEINI